MSTPFLDRYYASLERFFFEYPTEPARLIAEYPDCGISAERLAIYGRFVTGHVRRTIGEVFSACRALTPDAVWEGWTSAYYQRRPAKHYRLNRAADGFVAFLEEQADLPPYLLDLARFEWTKVQVYTGETEVPAEVSALTVNPTLVTLEHGWRICSYYARREQDPSPPVEGQEIALVWRDPVTRLVRYHSAGPTALLALKLALEGIESERAAAEGGVSLDTVEGAIAQQAARGLVLLPYPTDIK